MQKSITTSLPEIITKSAGSLDNAYTYRPDAVLNGRYWFLGEVADVFIHYHAEIATRDRNKLTVYVGNSKSYNIVLKAALLWSLLQTSDVFRFQKQTVTPGEFDSYSVEFTWRGTRYAIEEIDANRVLQFYL